MTNYSLVTVSKGEIKTVDAFIKTANSIGHNMKALCVSAYTFLNDDDKEVVKDFTARVMDELNYSNATLSQMKFTGEMYAEYNDFFKDFSYTNTYEFRKLINRLEVIDEAHIKHALIALGNFTNSRLGDDIEKCVEYLSALSQKALRDIINKYCDFLDGKVVEVNKEDVKEVTEEEVEKTEETTAPTEEVIEEVNEHIYSVTDDELNAIISALVNIDMNSTKKNIANEINNVTVMVDKLMK